ncbi:DUF3164 family protein [Pedobacter sp. SL55]|uniref:DUF3164 family protein n=1 Tax=Pedobacter sp. SL55 TaxID=2995161 RepID=UPI00226E11FA|nr:DUF3164 family protein [Pedobacter sp. SL55]WAC40555.1 DUF3164 family protein [Pedobacter sp. SL55]
MDLRELTDEQLEQAYKERKKAKQAQEAANKKRYEKKKDSIVEQMFDEALEASRIIGRLKSKMHVVMEAQKIELDSYGKIRTNSKGGFSVTHSNGELQIARRRDTTPVWDERASKAVELIQAFLADTIKKRDAKLYNILLGFLVRNKKNDLEYAKVMDLLTYESEFDDPRWIEGLRLIKESYTQDFKAYTYEFKRKNKAGKWQFVNLNFSNYDV